MDSKKIEINNSEQSNLNITSLTNSNFLNNSSIMDFQSNSLIPEKAEISPELKEQIERMVDSQFEQTYKKINDEFDKKIEDLINEKEEIDNKNEMIKAKYEALEEYLKNYCKKVNIDYESLLHIEEKK